MNNDDFRKLLATPSNRNSHSTDVVGKTAPSATFTHRQTGSALSTGIATEKKQKKKHFNTFHRDKAEIQEGDDLFDESEARLTEILKNYRDRAAERRKGVNSDEEVRKKLASGYKAVPGGFLSSNSIEEARKLEIQKSKYLGGDMEHTHLVKGLDYSLLNKIRTEMQEHEMGDQERDDDMLTIRGDLVPTQNKAANSKLAANICKLLFETKPPQRNDLFARGRMAYVVELEDEEVDVPSTLLRSVVDCPLDQSSENINADNLLINKLTQVLAYLRTDVKKRRKAGFTELSSMRGPDMNIFEGMDEYDPAREKRGAKRDREDLHKDGQKRTTSYFDSDRNRAEKERQRDRESDRKRERGEDEAIGMALDNDTEENLEKIKKRRLEQEDAYAELYPGGLGMIDAGGESDDEADYTKMDMGNRKGPVKRWDFETQDDYERYQSSREANPKAAYQFGVKTSGGRKTRKNTVAAKERKLDRELEKINKILDNRTKSGDTINKIRY